MSDYYVILTGSKNNAGDFLIKYRAKRLFDFIRPDRSLIEFDAWEKLDQERLNIVNQSQALILLGGPALQRNMFPGVYPLTPELEDITVPIVTLGIGWKSYKARWRDTYNYPLSDGAIGLLEKVNSTSVYSSVRDFQTLNVLSFKGLNNFIMTGCPAYYDLGSIGCDVSLPKKLNKVAFSLGVSFLESKSMEKLMKAQILAIKKRYSSSEFEVVFHHSLNADLYLNTHGAKRDHNDKHNEFALWLQSNNIKYVDISGSAENLISYYGVVDLHIGYRVHAHIFMNSISKLSLLISEDGRAKGSCSVIGGMVIDGYHDFKDSFFSKGMNKVFKWYDRYTANMESVKEALIMVDYEFSSQGQRLNLSRKAIDQNFLVMKSFLQSLP